MPTDICLLRICALLWSRSMLAWSCADEMEGVQDCDCTCVLKYWFSLQ